MNKIIVLAGVAGVGKSTYAKKFFPNNPYFSSDDYRVKYFGSLAKGNEHNAEVFDMMHKDMLKLLYLDANNTIVYDATNLTRKMRIPFYRKFSKFATIEIHYLFKPLAEILQQNKQRTGDARVPDHVIERMYRSQQPPRIGVDCDAVEVNAPSYFDTLSTDGINSLQDLVDHTNRELSPEFAANFIPHDSKFHTESVDEHIDATIANSNTETLKNIAIFHDLGKAQSKQFTDGTARFRNHENLGAIYAMVFFQSNFEEHSQEIEAILQHMLAFQGFSDKHIARHKLSKDDLQLIADFNKIDKVSSIPERTQK